MNKKKIIITIISLVIISLGAFWFWQKRNNKQETLFKTKTPLKQDIVQYVTASGTLKAKEQITVGSLEAGRVEKILVDDNDFVKKDQKLAILDNGIGDLSIKKLEATLWETKANLEYQEKFYDRQKQLFESNQISKDNFEKNTRDLEVLKARVTQTEAELDLAKRTYSYTFITSPANGVVISKEIDVGQMITARFQATVLFVIAKDLHEMEAQVDVDEADVGMVQDDQEVIFTVDAFPRIKFNAKVKQIKYLAKIIDNVVTYATILDIANPDLKLRPGMTTNVEIKVREAKNALIVKNKALRINPLAMAAVAKKLEYEIQEIKEEDKKDEIDTLWTLQDKTFRQIKVKLGAREGSLSQVISNQINDRTEIVYEVKPLERENILLKQVFGKPMGGIGKRNK